MRRLMQAVVVLAFLAGIAAADEIWLKDGRRIETKKPLVTKGSLALLTTTDGVLLSIPLSELDLEKTAAERARRAAPTPAPTPNLLKPLTPAEAAKQKSGRKAAVVLTDDTIAHGFDDGAGAKAEGDGEGRVDVANTSVAHTKDGYSFSGSVINAGKAEVSGISLTVELVGKNGATFSSAFAQLAKDTLAPGEKSTFTASAPPEGEAASFKYVPHWQIRIPVKPAGDTKTPGDSSSPKPAAEAEAAAARTPPPAPTYVPIPRSDVAPPAANPPTGNPASGAFIPQNDSTKPPSKPPGT
ncbi:MAG TPA: FxLYD domain-containing protein [Thermoanaerobaculia bacterium]|nr:FxLYD domain-containing protein [Thermoanaerobaculia bacterium]